jgi:peptide/nickel transport system substrate-binding protein
MSDANVALVNLKSGQVDMINRFPLNEVPNYASDAKIAVVNEPSPGFKGLVLNNRNEKFRDKRVRQAIDKAIDRKALVKVALSGVGAPARSALSATSWAYDEALDKAPDPDLEGARKLLADAGKAAGFSFTVVIDMDPTTQQIYQLIQSQLKAVKIDMQLQKQDFGTVLDRARKGDFEATSIGWSGRMDPDGNLYDWFHSGAHMNYMGYNNSELDRLLDQARTVVSQNERKVLYQKIMGILSDDVPYIFLYHDHNVFGISKSLQGFTPNPDGMIRTVDMEKK